MTSTIKLQQRDSETKTIWDNSVDQYQKKGFKLYWELLPAVEEYQLRSMTGNRHLHFFWQTLNFVRENIGERDLRALLVGCSEWNPSIEERLIGSGAFSSVKVIDIAKGLLERQKAISFERKIRGIEYVCQDLNEIALERNAYHLIWSVGTIHHIVNLEHLFDQMRESLRENGVLVMREYIGPNLLQFTEEQLAIVNEILKVLPEKYKKTYTGLIKEAVRNPDISQLMAADPSESIRSNDIMAVMKERFDVFKVCYTGGTILHPLLDGIASNFENSEEADVILRLLILMERIMIEKGVLQSDYVFCMARKKAGT
jgi:SAM-dependent methyltransferase